MAYLLNVSIGPVQGYIAAARRSRDLAYGSWLLSKLAHTAAQTIEDNQGKLIFPDENSLNKPNQGIANKIVAEFAEDPRAHAAMIEDNLREQLRKFWGATQKGQLIDDLAAQAQIDSLAEVTWVIVPIIGDYATARRRADRLLAAVKATRPFGSSAAWSGNAAKSSLTGQYESVIPPGSSETQYLKAYGASRNEQLSAIDLLKRLGKRGTDDSARFVSTSHMAALPLMRRFTGQESPALLACWKAYTSKLPNTIREFVPKNHERPFFGDDDGALLFIGRLEAAFERGDKSLPEHVERLNSFFQAVRNELHVGRPQPYYAILHADGDGMGRLIGEKTSADQHRELSRQLGDFAARAAVVVQQHGGEPVYTGGDDVLALLPLDTALACAQELSRSFAQEVTGATLSIGLAVTHHLTPLYEALDLARHAEKHAKNDAGRNALCVLLSKRSGGETPVYGQWGVFDTRLRTMVALHRTPGALPDGFAYELRELQRRLGDNMDDAVCAEARRLLTRKQTNNMAQEALLKWLEGDAAPDRLSQELIVARVFADAEDQANSELFTVEAQQ